MQHSITKRILCIWLNMSQPRLQFTLPYKIVIHFYIAEASGECQRVLPVIGRPEKSGLLSATCPFFHIRREKECASSAGH